MRTTIPIAWRASFALFLATIPSMFLTWVSADPSSEIALKALASGEASLATILSYPAARESILHGAQFTCTLLVILVAHELGHFTMARLHHVEASLPYFIPMPLLSPFGTMGAVIRMRGRIPTRKALLDIGASGPLAGLVFALPLYIWGICHSQVVPSGGPGMELGESLMLRALDSLAGPVVPEGMVLDLSPVAFAAWAGMFITMINLLPVGQLDGGHVAYALFGARQDSFARTIHRSMLLFFFVGLVNYLAHDIRAGIGFHRFGTHVGNSMFWLVWFELLAILGELSAPARDSKNPATGSEARLTWQARVVILFSLAILGGYGRDHNTLFVWGSWFTGLGVLLFMEWKGGALRSCDLLNHPPTGIVPLDPTRKLIAIVTLLFFALLFMPVPISM